MKITIDCKTVRYNTKLYKRCFYTDFSYFKWYDLNGNEVENYLVKILEKEYQNLISTQTPNPSEKKGFDHQINSIINELETAAVTPQPQVYIAKALKDIKKLEKIRMSYPHDFKEKINEIIDYLNQANGETPEEANPVGQTSISFSKTEIDELIDVLSIGQKYSKDWEFKMKMVIKLLTGKPLETTKEQPLYTEENMKQFGIFLAMNYNKSKYLFIDDIFKKFKG